MTLDGNYDKEEKANVVTTIFGGDENVDLRSSAIPSDFDEWFHGDFKKSWEGTLGGALSLKSLEEYTDDFPSYRINSAVEIGIDTDGETISNSEVKMTDPNDSSTSGGLSPVTLEGGSDEPGNIFRNEFDHYDDGYGQKHPADDKGPYTKKNKTFSVDGIEGVRASLILGGSDPYLRKLKKDITSLAEVISGDVPIILLRYMAHVATFYSFIDFAFMADGTKVVTVWDASVYPAHALFVGEDRKDRNQFREGIEWVEQGWTWEHQAFIHFGLDAQHPAATPFDQGGAFLYGDTFFGEGFREGAGDHPVMEFTSQGSTLSGSESEFTDPMFPNFPTI